VTAGLLAGSGVREPRVVPARSPTRMFRASSREIVDGSRFNRLAIARTPRPSARSTPIRSRSSSDRYRPERVSSGNVERASPPRCARQ
jgi:hypothetical protein